MANDRLLVYQSTTWIRGNVGQLPDVGFIGLGVMGRPMSLHLLRAGYPLTVYSRSAGPVEALVAAGARSAASPRDVAAVVDVLIVMLPTTRDLQEVLLGEGGARAGLRPGSIVVDMGTDDPSAVRAIASALRTQDCWLVDAPVSGGQVGAESGTLSIMVGGEPDVVAKVRPVLAAMGRNVVHVGGVGAGQVAKACNQLVVASTIQAVAEALALASAAGLDPRRVREAMLDGFAASRVLELHGRRMLDGDFEPGGRVALHAKDAHIVLETAEQLGVELPGFAPVAGQLDALVERGDGNLDHSALVTLLAAESERARWADGAPGADQDAEAP